MLLSKHINPWLQVNPHVDVGRRSPPLGQYLIFYESLEGGRGRATAAQRATLTLRPAAVPRPVQYKLSHLLQRSAFGGMGCWSRSGQQRRFAIGSRLTRDRTFVELRITPDSTGQIRYEGTKAQIIVNSRICAVWNRQG